MVRVSATRTKGSFHLFLTHYVVHEFCAELEGIFEDGCFGKAHVLVPTIMELFKRFLLLVCEALFKFLVMPCHVAE